VARIVVLGAGLAGSAFCVPLADQGHEVSLVGTHVDRQIIQALAQGGFHPRLGMCLPPSVMPLRLMPGLPRRCAATLRSW
jgi:glycerol-3-phosphate dehydrogenase (NAD(P)+)